MQIALLEKYNQGLGGVFNNKDAEINRLEIQQNELLSRLELASEELYESIGGEIKTAKALKEGSRLKAEATSAAGKLGITEKLQAAEAASAEVFAAKSVAGSKALKAVVKAKAAVVEIEELQRTKPEKPSVWESIKNGFSYAGACLMSAAKLAKKAAVFLYSTVKGAVKTVYTFVKDSMIVLYALFMLFVFALQLTARVIMLAACNTRNRIEKMLGIKRKNNKKADKKDEDLDPYSSNFKQTPKKASIFEKIGKMLGIKSKDTKLSPLKPNPRQAPASMFSRLLGGGKAPAVNQQDKTAGASHGKGEKNTRAR